MTADVFNPRCSPALLSEHFHVQQESPLASPTKIRRLLKNVSAQKLSGRNRLAIQVNSGLAGQSEISERAQRAHDLWSPCAAHIDQPNALAQESMNCMRLGMRHVEGFDLAHGWGKTNPLLARERGRFDELPRLPEKPATAGAEFIEHRVQ